MGYRIDFRVGSGVLERLSSAEHVLIDIRGLQHRHGRLRSLLAAKDLPERVAVIDGWHSERCTIFAEMAARRLGCDLRRIEDHRTALAWLRSAAA